LTANGFEFQCHLKGVFQSFLACFAFVNFQQALKRGAVIILRVKVTRCGYDFPVLV
jgi:hypothetical protein